MSVWRHDILATAPLLAGQYRGNQVERAVTHYVVTEDFVAGRFARIAGETLCRPHLETAEDTGLTTRDVATCPACLRLAVRHQLTAAP